MAGTEDDPELLTTEQDSQDHDRERKVKRELVLRALEVRSRAYAPYSGFFVGAAVRTKSGQVFVGCNVENASYGLTLCAERSAIVAAVAQGDRDLESIAVVADTELPVSPCGACRQFIAEFGLDIEIILENLAGQRLVMTSGELLPFGFGPAQLKKSRENRRKIQRDKEREKEREQQDSEAQQH